MDEEAKKERCRKLWAKCLAFIRDNIDKQEDFDRWFAQLIAYKLDSTAIYLQAPSQFFVDTFEGKYIKLLSTAVRKEIGKNIGVKYLISLNTKDIANSSYQLTSSYVDTENYPTRLPIRSEYLPSSYSIPGIQAVKFHSNLNGKYTFANFVVGKSNKAAKLSCQMISERPGTSGCNPLFIYSKTGLGKTHLLNATGIEIKKNYPNLVVVYITAERFTKLFVEACNEKRANDFVNYFQNVDVLLIDDVHIWGEGDKSKTQDAFFSIFNYLQSQDKQIVLTSDKAPNELSGIEPRVLSRFKWGISVPIDKPDEQTRVAILKEKLVNNGVTCISDEIVRYIAQRTTSNIREMEGVLNTILFQAINCKDHSPIVDSAMAKRVIDRIVTAPQVELNLESIKNFVCQHLIVDPSTVFSDKRQKDIVQARQLIMYLAKKYTNLSLSTIGSQCGGKTHATVLHSCNKVDELMSMYPSYRILVEELSNGLAG